MYIAWASFRNDNFKLPCVIHALLLKQIVILYFYTCVNNTLKAELNLTHLCIC